ncbi:sperm microtubule inner protein 8-like isoform X2 [Watersipora subatra]|uniref:sperm microtubule inner protein 8-like isoform X2 n=1 Tax=Watersipora subatra TaxID=2589382 RepID=UPI00355B0A92
MTTIGVPTYKHDNPKDMHMPSYSYPTPAGRRVQLVSVKEGIFHPRLPTLRQLERHKVLHKLSNEHCRSSLPREAVCKEKDSSAEQFIDFKRASTVDPSALRTRGNDFDESQVDPRYQYTPLELKKTREDWSNFLNRCPERFNIKLTEHPDTANTPYTGYAMRYLKPEITAKWKYTLKQEPNIDPRGQRPTPANILNRHRNVYTRSSTSVSTDPYKPPYANHTYHM